MFPGIRRRVFEILDAARPGDRVSLTVDVALITLISFNVLAVILETVPRLAATHGPAFAAFERFSIIIFTLEYFLRVWSSVESDPATHKHPVFGRLRYMLTPMALIDLIAILPFYLGFLVGFDLRFMRVVRLLRVFKLTHYSSSMSLLLEGMKDEARAIGASLFILMLLIVIAASFTYLAEHEAQPEAFGSIPQAMWWAVITMTTVGYGDMVPITTMGKFLGAGIGIIGIGMVALPAGLLASGFSNQVHRRKRRYSELVEDVLEDGVITENERDELEETRLSLALSKDDAEELLESEIRRSGAGPLACPHCGKHLDARRDPG